MSMDYYTIANTDLNVSKICFGTMTFGGQTSDAESIALIEAALADGINFFDTADFYNQGRSEVLLGKAIAGKRDQVVIASKVYYAVDENDDVGLSPARMRSHLAASLRRLGTDYLDIYYLHQPDEHTPLEETLAALDQFKKEGKIRHYGVSNYAAWQIAEMMCIADRMGVDRPVVTQNVYNAITRGIEAELVPYCASVQLPILAYNPLAGGLLTGKYNADEEGTRGRLTQDEMYNKRYLRRHNLNAVAELADVTLQMGRSLVEICLLWVCQHSAIQSIILGVSNMKQYKENMSILASDPLSKSEMNLIQAIGDAHFNRGFDYFRYGDTAMRVTI